MHLRKSNLDSVWYDLHNSVLAQLSWIAVHLLWYWSDNMPLPLVSVEFCSWVKLSMQRSFVSFYLSWERHLRRFSLWTSSNKSVEIIAGWWPLMTILVSASTFSTYTPSLICVLPKTTSPRYFSFLRILEIVSLLQISFPVGESTFICANEVEIFPRLSPAAKRSKMWNT